MDCHFIHSPNSTVTHCHSPCILRRADGELSLIFYSYPSSEIKGAVICLATTQNHVWQKTHIIQESSGTSLGNPVIFEEPAGHFHIIYTSIESGYWDTASLRYIESTNPTNYSSPKKLNTPPGHLTRHPPIKTLDGRWLLPVYDEKNMTSHLLRSTKSLSKWEDYYQFPNEGIIQGQLLRLKDNSLAIVFRPMKNRDTIQCAISKDDGLSWSELRDTGLPCPKSGISACTDGNTVFIIYNHNTEMKRYPLSMSASSDQLNTWSTPWHLDEMRFELSYPHFLFENGKINGVYTYNRRMIKNITADPREIKIPSSTLEKKSICDFKNIHRDKSLFIIASGPSIKDLDLSPLDRRLTMGLNRSFMKYKNTYYHSMFDQRLFDTYEEQLKDHRCLFTLKGRPWGVQLENLGADGFSFDIDEGIYTGYTISFFALQLAIYMGFKKIFFLGLDLNNVPGQTHFFGYDHHSSNHNDTEFPKMLDSFRKAQKYLKNHDVEVYNCSLNSALDAFPKISFEKAIEIS